LNFSINPGYVYYLNEENQRGININYSPGFRLFFLNRFVLSCNYQYQRRKERATVEFDQMTFVETKVYRASMFYETARMTTFGFSASISNMGYEDVITPEGEISYSTALNRKAKNANFEFYYRILRESDFFLTAGYNEYNFEDPESQWRNSYSYQVISGIRFPLLGRARGVLSLGYRWLINRSDENIRFSGLIGDTSLEFMLGRFNLRFQYGRDVQFSFSRENSYFINHGFGSGISFYLTQFIRLDYNFSYGEGEYPKKQNIQLPEQGFEKIKRKDTYLAHSAGIVFRIIRNVGIGLTINYWERGSKASGVGRKRTFIGGYLTYNF
jgi:hypothetical protein